MDAINQPLLDIRDLSVEFRQQGSHSIAVDRISFSIGRGQCVALVGESGSGKSVSALSILKLLPYPNASHPSGSIHFKGRDLLTLTEHQMRGIRGNDISIIFQEPMTSLNPLHTIESQIGEILQLHSGIRGQMARARTLQLLADVGIVRRIADVVCVMNGGKIVEHGPVEQVFTAAKHPYTRALLAAEPKPDPAPPQPQSPVVMSTDGLKVWFPVRRGLLRRTVGHIKAVDGVSVSVRKGETLGVVGESG